MPGLDAGRIKDTHSNNRFTYRFGTYTKEQLQIDKIPDDSMISNYRGYQGECSSARVTSDFLKFPVIFHPVLREFRDHQSPVDWRAGPQRVIR